MPCIQEAFELTRLHDLVDRALNLGDIVRGLNSRPQGSGWVMRWAQEQSWFRNFVVIELNKEVDK